MSEENEAMDLIGEIMGETIEGVKEETSTEVPVVEESPATPEKNSEDDLDFGDMPNGKIRYEKLKKQREERDARILELEREVARRAGREEVLTATEEEEEEEYMTDEEKQRNADRLRVEKLEAEINEMKAEKQRDLLKARDKRFFDKHPELNNPEDKAKLLAFIRSREGTASDLLAGVTSMEEVHAMMNPMSNRKTTQDSSNVFGSTPNSSAPARAIEQKINDVDIARRVLNDPESTNKADATNILLDSLVANFNSSAD